jgi:flagellar protein FliS
MNHPAQAYRQFSVQGSSPLGLVVMLYDGAIASLRRAVIATEARDIPAKCHHLKRVLAIIVQLEETLNFELGGEVAQTLKTFYMYSRAQAMKANIENSAEILRSLIEKFSTVREAWHQAEHGPPPSPTSSASEGSPGAPSPPKKSGSWRTSA